LGKATEKLQQARDDIEDASKKIDEVEPWLTSAKEEAFVAEKWMKEAQEHYLKTKKECEDQCLEIEELKIPCERLKQETHQDFELVSFLCIEVIAPISRQIASSIFSKKRTPV